MESEHDFVIGSRSVKVRCRMPHGGDKAIWSILVDSTWYGMNRECQHDDTAQAIEKLATEWLEHDYPDVARE